MFGCESVAVRLNLALEPFQRLRVGRFARPDQLDGAGALQELVLGQVDLAHPAGAEQPPEAILPELSGLSDLPAQPGDRAGPVRRADGQDGQDQRVEGEEQGPRGPTMRGRAIGPLLPEPRHGRRVLQGQHREGREREQGERPDDDRGARQLLGT